MKRSDNLVRLKRHLLSAMDDYKLELYGDHLAKIHKYPSTVYGFDAVYLYLFRTHGWSFDRCRSMHKADIRLALANDFANWLPPPDAHFEFDLPQE
ncbi:hypothetical protein XS16_005291 [Salmonella enterica subsp. enterica serovar Newport]|nr:hypothetical protein [Salmonella enterica subsp. enterica serovar Newport]